MQAFQLLYSIKQKKTVKPIDENIKIYCFQEKLQATCVENGRDFH